MNQLFGAFLLGNAAILTNVCLLPLYPGLIAFLAGNAANERVKRVTPWLGLMVLLGILSLMTLIGLLLYLLQATFGGLLAWLVTGRLRRNYRAWRADALRRQPVFSARRCVYPGAA